MHNVGGNITMENSQFIIDKVENVSIDPNRYVNEFNGLMNLRSGLISLYNSIRPTEVKIFNESGGNVLFMFGNHPSIPAELSNLLPSYFYWFSISLANYARLNAYLCARENGLLTDIDVGLTPNKEKIKKTVNDYVKGVVEIQELIKWRNKLAAHFALTDPRTEDNISTLESSILYPVGFENNRFWTGTMLLTRGDGQNSFSSEIPRWALTELFERLKDRFWPDIEFRS